MAKIGPVLRHSKVTVGSTTTAKATTEALAHGGALSGLSVYHPLGILSWVNGGLMG